MIATVPIRPPDSSGRSSETNVHGQGYPQPLYRGVRAKLRFRSYTAGYILPEADVVLNGRRLTDDSWRATVVNAYVVPHELRFNKGLRHSADPWRRALKKLIVGSWFLPDYGTSEHWGLFYRDECGHPHAMYRPFDLYLTAGLRVYLMTARTLVLRQSRSANDAFGLLSSTKDSQRCGALLDPTFVARCWGILSRYGVPYGGELPLLDRRLDYSLQTVRRLEQVGRDMPVLEVSKDRTDRHGWAVRNGSTLGDMLTERERGALRAACTQHQTT